MDDPTGGMWIYLIFFLIPLARILPRMIRKFKNKASPGGQPEKFEEKAMWQPKPPKKKREPFFEEEIPKKDDGWLSKDDFKNKN